MPSLPVAPDSLPAADAADPTLAAILHRLPDIVFRHDRDGRILFVNDAVLSATGHPPAHYIGRLGPEVNPSAVVAAQFETARRTVFATGQPTTFEVRRPTDEGVRWFEYRVVPERAPDGTVETVLSIGREVTDLHAALDALRAGEARYRSLVEASSQIVWHTGPAGERVADDPATARSWLGFTRAAPADVPPLDSRDHDDDWLADVHPDDRDAARTRWHAALAAGRPFEQAFRLRRADGAWRHVVARGVPVCGADAGTGPGTGPGTGTDAVAGWVGTITDVTEQAETQAALRESERRLATLLSHVPGMAYRMREDGGRWVPEFVSEGALALSGYTAEEIMGPHGGPHGLDVEALVHEADRPRVRAARDAAFVAGTPYEVTYRITRRDGATRWLWEQGREVPAPLSALPGSRVAEGLVVDVTDREEGRAALEAERARLLEAQRIGRLGSWSWREASGEIHVSEGWNRIFGVSTTTAHDPETLFRSLVAPEDQARYAARLAQIRSTRPGTTEGRWRIVRPDGERRVVHMRSEWRYDADGTLLEGKGTFQDVTEQVEAQNALRLSQEQQVTLLQSIPDPAWLKDVEGCYLAVNEAFLRARGRRADEVLGRTSQEVFGAAGRQEQDDGAHALAAGGPVRSERSERDETGADGEPRWFETVEAPYHDSAGRVAGTVGIARETTERRRLEEQVRHAQKMDALGMLAGSVAHDFNNLLSAIIGGTELARLDVPDGTELARDLDDVRHAGARAAQLTRQLLAFSRKQVRRPRVLDLRDTVRDAEKLLRRLLPDDVALDLAYGPTPCVVSADAGQLEQVLMNLVVNARDAITATRELRGGGPNLITVETACQVLAGGDPRLARPGAAALPAGTYAALVVRDTGAGMDAATRARIFEPFFTTKPAGQGTGLGLSTVFGIVGQSGGAVLADSAPGAGARFTVLLPIVDRPVDTLAVGASALPGGTETILLVEDEGMVREMATRILERHGYRVVAARHGGDALLAWQEHGAVVDAVVTDLRMPEVNGQTLVARLRAERPSLPIVFMSGYAGGETPADTALLARERFLAKPFTTETLLVQVRAALDERKR